MFTSKLRMMLAVSAIVILAMPVAEGFALPAGYFATTVCSGNSVSAEYFTISFYTYNDFENESPSIVENYSINDFTPLSGTAFSSEKIKYSTNGSQKVINGSFTLTEDNLYMIIMGNDEDYTIANGGLSVSITGLGQSASITNTLTVGVSTSNYHMTNSNAYHVSLVSDISYTYTGEDPEVTVSMSITSVIVGKSSGAYAVAPYELELASSGIVSDLTELNSGEGSDFDPETGNYSITPSSQTYSSGGSEYDAVGISANGTGGYLTSDGTVDFTLYIPANKEFVVMIKSVNHKGYLTLNVTCMNNQIQKTYAGDFTVNGNKQIFCYPTNPSNSTGITTHSTFDPNYAYWHWFSSDGNITLHVTNRQGYSVADNIRLDIIMRDKPTE